MRLSNRCVLSLSLLLALASCSPRLVGTWTVQKYETMVPGQQGTSVSNVGTITFKKNYTGNKDIHYTVFGVQRDNTSSFTWSATKSYVTIHTTDSEFAKTWLLIKDDKNFQRWQATNGNNQIQTLELKR